MRVSVKLISGSTKIRTLMTDFKGKKILITGASRGIGFESAKIFLAAGAHVIGTGRDQERLDRASAELSTIGDFHPLIADFEDPAAPALVAQAVEVRWDSLDFLLNNAAVQTYKSDWEDVGAVEVLPLDEILSMNQIKRVAAIKIDAEGFELKVLSGAT